MKYLFSPVQLALILQEICSVNGITALNAESVFEVQLVVKDPPPPDPEACGCFLTNCRVFIDDKD